jgi:threonine dehydrogenase-like Zn-dependent dehydrogenase
MTYGSYLVNDPKEPLRFSEIETVNPARSMLRGLEPKEGIKCKTVLTGFCGTDYELMRMGREGELSSKFPPGRQRLINGHEGVVWVPSQKRYVIVLIRGGDSYDPTRFEDDETYFEYGCDQADGLMSYEGYYHPDMLLEIPAGYLKPGEQITRTLAKRLTFADPFACMLFQKERLEDLLVGHNWRVYAARGLAKGQAEKTAVEEGFSKIVLYGLGTTTMLAAIIIAQDYPAAQIVAVGRSNPDNEKVHFLRHWPNIQYVQIEDMPAKTSEKIKKVLGGKPKIFIGASGNGIEAEIAFKERLLSNNGIYAGFSLGPVISYDSMPFGFKNQLIFGAINFRKDHMEEAIRRLCMLPMEEIVREYPLDDLSNSPLSFYEEVYRSKTRALKSVIVWDDSLVRD